MGRIRTVWSDFLGISQACGVGTALNWSLCVGRSAARCLAEKNLQPADRLMGRGPFAVRRRAARAQLLGEQVFSGLREIWVRDVYLQRNFLRIDPNAVVVDLGANLGNFSLLALASPGTRVIAVEPSRRLSESLARAVAHNGWFDRLSLEKSFIGNLTEVQLRVLSSDPDYAGAQCISELEFIEKWGLRHIDFLKCDIEGSEFFLLHPSSRLLSMTRQLAIEIHPWGGDIAAFIEALRSLGFVFGPVKYDARGGCIALAKR